MGQALYRKHRPKSLAEIVGQEHVTTTLTNALKQGRISHAYLLTGPRGVGKTSIARILAHEINGLPYDDEAHLDIIEIDAASNRRIDEIRDLRDRVNTAPAAAKYKVYIIDEVHMLTKEAFNALLKTLEEPPAHVVFILATTESHKLPDTIISRTQRYTFRPVDRSLVVDHLRVIAKTEAITIDDAALELIAEHGEGSFRDSISLLDQASTASDQVSRADIERILGRAPAESLQTLSAALTGHDAATIVSTLQSIYAAGYEPAMVAIQLGDLLRTAVLGGTAQDGAGNIRLLERLLDIPAARDPKRLLELVLLETTITTVNPTLQTTANAVVTPKQPARNTPPKPAPVPVRPDAATDETTLQEPIAPPVQRVAAPPDDTVLPESPIDETNMVLVAPDLDTAELWQQTLDAIKAQYNTLYGIARMATPSMDGDTLTLSLKFAFHQKRLSEVKNRKIFSEVLQRLSGRPLDVKFVVADALSGDQAKPDVSAISNIFGGAELLQ